MIDTPEKVENITFDKMPGSPCPPPRGMQPRPGQVVCGDIDMRIAADGTWYYGGTPIHRQKLVKLFSTVVRRDEAGAYWLITPAEMARIKVDDAPFLAVEMSDTNDKDVIGLKFRTNVDKWVRADIDHPIRVDIDPETDEPRPYIQLASDGTEARIVRSVFYDIVEKAEVAEMDGRSMLIVKSAGATFVLGPAPEEA